VKLQYLGDENDYRKFRLLRHFAGGGRIKIGVHWMLTPDDQGRDGRKIGYLRSPHKWRSHDPAVFDLLASLVDDSGQRLLQNIEQSCLIPGALFFNDFLADRRNERAMSMAAMLQTLRDADLIFLDPDNGIEVKSRPKGRKNSCKYVYWDEIGQISGRGQSLLIYQHFTRESRGAFVARKVTYLAEHTGAAEIWTISTPHVVFFLAALGRKSGDLAELTANLVGRFPDLRVERKIV
jgi:hypothetical protein